MTSHTPPARQIEPSPDRPEVRLRPAQAQVLEYTGGPMGVTAVPGSGKTFVLSLLAARLVGEMAVRQANTAADPAAHPDTPNSGADADAEVLVVTMTNSAVENFRERIARFLSDERTLIPGVGYRVRTLHGLAHDIVRERPGLVALSDEFDILDERTSNEVKDEIVREAFRRNPEAFAAFVKPDKQRELANPRGSVLKDIGDVAQTVIRVAKQARVAPGELVARLDDLRGHWPLLDFGVSVYAEYQRALEKRGAVDFDDLIVLALRALDSDPAWLARLQARWPWVLEDEAQDSNLLQEEMLRRLTQASGNWVRVGDPNQAITTTFSGADMRYLRRFLADHPEGARALPNSGRSSREIIDLANRLIRWSQAQPLLRNRGLALTDPLIEPAPEGDPQPNPPGVLIYLWDRPNSPDAEIEATCKSLARWVPANPDKSAAVLAPDNNHAFRVLKELTIAGVPVDDSLLRTSAGTRAGALALSTVLEYLAHPTRAEHAARVWSEAWWPLVGHDLVEPPPDDAEPLPAARVLATNDAPLPEPVRQFRDALHRLSQLERFVFPIESDWLDECLEPTNPLRPIVERFRSDLQQWTRATVLPVDELVLFVGNGLFSHPGDLALAHRLALHLDKLARENPTLRLGSLAQELRAIAENKRKFAAWSDEGEGYVARAGVVTVSTMHSAKGLEWDRVHLLAVSDYEFPTGEAGSRYRGDRFWVRDGLSLTAEVEAQVRGLIEGSLDAYVAGAASEDMRIESAAEKLRLLYVGITRARSELVITFNTGKQNDGRPLEPAAALRALLE